MNKEQIVSFIQEQLNAGKISKEDLSLLADNKVISNKEESSRNIINTFYSIGAIILLIGIIILIAQNWTEIGFIGRISVTLGISLLTYIVGFLLNKPSQRVISQVMFTISSALAPLGIYVLLNEANILFIWPYTLYTGLALSAIFGYAFWASKKNILVLITIGYASWVYYALLSKILILDANLEMLKWSGMFLGFSYILIAYGYQSRLNPIDAHDKREKTAIKNVLFGLGTLLVLSSGISIGGFFDIIFIAFIFTAFYGSVYLKNQAMLSFGALFLMAHIIKLTSKYFVDSIGWPVSLIIIGFLIIGVGYGSYNLNKKYIVNG